MAADQQFCLRWNNHQSTLVTVFDQLLEKGTLVDCTLAAEGQLMKAHKVVLSACSPYFELMLSQYYEKHPIIVLKDVKYQELKAIMDYMYRGEVNILQEQLGSLLKVAESLQIKGLSESGGNEEKPQERKKPPVTPQRPQAPVSHSENRRAPVNQSTPLAVASPPTTPRPSRDECPSPVSRKRKKYRQNSSEDGSTSALLDGLETSSSSELPPQRHPVPKVSGIPATVTSVPVKPPTPMQPVIEEKIEPLSRPPSQVSLPDTSRAKPPPPPLPIETEVTPKLEPTTEVMIQPKAEYIEEEEDIEDLTLDDDEELNMSDHAIAGPSHGGDESSQGFQQWQLGDQSQDEVFMAAQEAVGAQRDSQGTSVNPFSDGSQEVEYFPCPDCNKKYKYKSNLSRHRRLECGKEPQFQCPYCPKRMTQKSSLIEHITHLHPFVCSETPTDNRLLVKLKEENVSSGNEYLGEENQFGEENVTSEEEEHFTQIDDFWNEEKPSREENFPQVWKGITCKEEIISQEEEEDFPNTPSTVRHSGIALTSVKSVEKSCIGYTCEWCGKVYASKGSVNAHKKQFCEEKHMVSCIFCGYKSKNKFHIEKHMKDLHT